MRRWSVSKAVLVGGGIGGALDILYAIGFWSTRGIAPERVLQSVASGWLGKAAYDGGLQAAAIGLASHFLLAMIWAAAFVTAAKSMPKLVARPWATAIVFGLAVFLVMRLVVLPLSAFPGPVRFDPVPSLLDLMSHMFLFALPIVSAARRAVGPRY